MMRRFALLVCTLLGACHTAGEVGPRARGEPSAAVAVARAGVGNVERTILTYGTAEFSVERQRTLSFVRPGQVVGVPVVAGQTVKRGDVLLLVGGVPRGSPEVEQASIELAFAEREVARVQRLLRENMATNQELSNAEKQRAAARAALSSLGGSGAPIRASADGIVARVLVQRGDLVQEGQPGIVLASGDSMTVRAGFEVEDLPELREKLPVRISPVYGDTKDTRAEATLSTLHRVVNPQTQLVEGLIGVPKPPAWMAAGLAVRVVVVLESEHDVLLVPRDALVDQGGKRGVFVVEQGHAHFRALTVGMVGVDRVQVRHGLSKGDAVVTTGRSSLSDGMAVRFGGTAEP
jgi:RND family efflux transporter MFP subunit